MIARLRDIELCLVKFSAWFMDMLKLNIVLSIYTTHIRYVGINGRSVRSFLFARRVYTGRIQWTRICRFLVDTDDPFGLHSLSFGIRAGRSMNMVISWVNKHHWPEIGRDGFNSPCKIQEVCREQSCGLGRAARARSSHGNSILFNFDAFPRMC